MRADIMTILSKLLTKNTKKRKVMSALENAEKKVLKRKVDAERESDLNLNKLLQDERAKILFVKCKRLVVEIAKLEVDGKDSSSKREEYNNLRALMAELLKELGVSKDSLKPRYHCPKCKDMGYLNGKMCDCLKKEYSKELVKQSGIDVSMFPKFSKDYSIFDDEKEAKCIYAKMKKFVDEKDKTNVDTVLIAGDTGVGKTHLIECMTSYAIDKSIAVKYTTAFNFNKEMLCYHCATLENKDEILAPYLKSEILFIDDLGSENKIKNVTNEYLYLVLNERMLNHKKTVITTNLDFEQIQDVYGERIFSRLMHKKQSLKIKFSGSDLRLK